MIRPVTLARNPTADLDRVDEILGQLSRRMTVLTGPSFPVDDPFVSVEVPGDHRLIEARDMVVAALAEIDPQWGEQFTVAEPRESN